MKIELKEMTVRDLAEGYQDNDEAGVVGYSGKLDIRPPYQREFIYKDKQRDAVIDTVTWRRWRPTTSPPGMRVAGPTLRTA